MDGRGPDCGDPCGLAKAELNLGEQFSRRRSSPFTPLHREDRFHISAAGSVHLHASRLLISQTRLLKFSPGAPVTTLFTAISESARTASRVALLPGADPFSPNATHARLCICIPSRAARRLLIADPPRVESEIRPAPRATAPAPAPAQQATATSPALARRPPPASRPLANLCVPGTHECIRSQRAKPTSRRFLDRYAREQLLVWIVRQRGRWIGSAHCPQLVRQRDQEDLFSYDRVQRRARGSGSPTERSPWQEQLRLPGERQRHHPRRPSHAHHRERRTQRRPQPQVLRPH